MTLINLERKKTIVSKINAIAKKSLSAVIADFNGISANKINTLRKHGREVNVYISVIRNTLLFRALHETQFKCLKDMLNGSTLIACSVKEANAAARLLKNFSKDNISFKIKAAACEGKLILPENIDLLANQLSYNEALIKLILTFKEASIGKLLRTFCAIYRKKEL